VTYVTGQNNTGNAEKTLGILSAQRYDENRATLKMLAFQSFKQACLGAVYPDSTPSAFDKRNVRDGHYSIWGYLWSFAKVNGGQITSPLGKRLVEFIGGTAVINGVNPLEATVKAGAVPTCAMSVKRAADGADLEKYEPATPCTCFYEKAASGSTGCEACPAGTCSGGKTCRHGYCEAR
jgi:hypothetical protein